MKSSNFMSLTVIVGLIVCGVILFVQPTKTATKFHQEGTFALGKACGSNLDEHSACGICGTVVGVPITHGTTCGHACVTLPGGRKDTDFVLKPFAAEVANNGSPSAFQPCGNGDALAVCAIQWSEFIKREYFQSNNQLCGSFKNWSDDRDRVAKIVVDEK